MPSVSGAVSALRTAVRGVTGIRASPDKMIETPGVWPWAMSFASAVPSVTQPTKMVRKADIVIRTEIHYPRQNLEIAYSVMDDFALSVPKAIWADTSLGGHCDTITSVSGNLIPGKLGEIDTIVWVFQTTIKIDAL